MSNPNESPNRRKLTEEEASLIFKMSAFEGDIGNLT
jgi:hypothetical protein